MAAWPRGCKKKLSTYPCGRMATWLQPLKPLTHVTPNKHPNNPQIQVQITQNDH